MPAEQRVARLVSDYSALDKAALETAIRNIERRLGNEAMKQAITALYEEDYATVVRLTLHYYDKAYDKSLTGREPNVQRVEASGDLSATAAKLMELSHPNAAK